MSAPKNSPTTFEEAAWGWLPDGGCQRVKPGPRPAAVAGALGRDIAPSAASALQPATEQ